MLLLLGNEFNFDLLFTINFFNFFLGLGVILAIYSSSVIPSGIQYPHSSFNKLGFIFVAHQDDVSFLFGTQSNCFGSECFLSLNGNIHVPLLAFFLNNLFPVLGLYLKLTAYLVFISLLLLLLLFGIESNLGIPLELLILEGIICLRCFSELNTILK